MFDFFIRRSCDCHGSIDCLQTGFPTDLYPDELGADDIPGGEDIEYHRTHAECCPSCGSSVEYGDREEFYERIFGHEL